MEIVFVSKIAMVEHVMRAMAQKVAITFSTLEDPTSR